MSEPITTRPWFRRRRVRWFAGMVGGLSLVGGHVARAGGHPHAQGCECAVPAWLAAPAALQGAPAAPAVGRPFRVATYNIHSGLGPDLTFGEPRADVERNLERIAAAIVAAAPEDAPMDVVGLNEVDFAARRSGGFDQAAFLARALHARTGHAYTVVAGVTWERRTPGREVRFGNALLVRHPVRESAEIRYDDDPEATREGDPLPAVRSPRALERLVREARGAVKATLDVDGATVDVIVTHLDAFSQSDREAQAVHLLRHHLTPGRTTVLLGDLNAVPTPMTLRRSPFEDDLTHDLLTSGDLVDARVVLAARQGANDLTRWATFPVGVPLWPLDGVLATRDLIPVDAAPIGDDASDHRGLAATYLAAPDDAAAGAYAAWHAALRARQLTLLERCSSDDALHLALIAGDAKAASRRRRLLAASGYRDLRPR